MFRSDRGISNVKLKFTTLNCIRFSYLVTKRSTTKFLECILIGGDVFGKGINNRRPITSTTEVTEPTTVKVVKFSNYGLSLR